MATFGSVALGAGRVQMFRFAVVGTLNTAVDVILFALLYQVLGIPSLQANILSYSTGVINSYLCNGRWTFAERGEGQGVRGFGLFFVLNMVGLALSCLVVLLLEGLLPAMTAKLCATGVTFCWNFWSSRRFVYIRQCPGH